MYLTPIVIQEESVTGLNPTETEVTDLIHNVDTNEDGKMGNINRFILIKVR